MNLSESDRKLEELLAGPKGGSAFDSDEERFRCWNMNREFVEQVAERVRPGSRPWGWWRYVVQRRFDNF